MKILFFSATGNGLCIANSFKEEYGAQLLSIPKLIESNTYTVEDDVVGIVVPVYKLGIPSIVDQYLKKLEINSKYTFVIANHALFSFETHVKMKDYDFEINYLKQMKMPNNYIPMFDMNKTHFNKEKYEEEIGKILSDVGTKRQYTKYNKIKYLIGNVARLFTNYSYADHDNKFYVDESCTKCKVCQKVCPSNNIEVNDSVEFLHNCEYCLACISSCKVKALHHKNEKSTARYTNPVVNINDYL